MRNSNRVGLVLAITVMMLGVAGCNDDDDDMLSLPVADVVEAGLDETLQTVVVPLVTFYGAIGDFLAAPRAVRGGFGCPDTTGWCSSGTVSCTATEAGLAFDWDACMVVTGDDPITVDGSLNAVPGDPVLLTLTNLVVNNSPGMTGTGTIDLSGCSYAVDVDTADATVNGVITQCDENEYPTGNVLTIGFDDFLITIVLNGTNTAIATATEGGTPVADCTIDLDSDPLTSSCVAY